MTYNKEALNVIETLQSTINNEEFQEKILNIAYLIKKITMTILKNNVMIIFI